ncbi:N-acetylmuramoyl-L-alanine amidase [Terribacillus sp. 179-K 1B1 HS]|uniref:peptidoglycan recognition protein family protein n=1 Tax=Terribacillus sp. 179-K 1B1 HS TaxID=3142388 RepID=UPI00399F2BA3
MAIKNKYTIEQKYITNKVARPRKKLTGGKPSFIVDHETANNSADAEAHYRYFQGTKIAASAHTFIDADTILEIIPLDEVAYHVQYQKPIDNQMFGDDANDDAIGIELCRTGNFAKAYDRYVWYNAYLCKKFGISTSRIVAHKTLDPERRTDPESWLNPNGITWAEFIADVKTYVNAWEGDANVKIKQPTKTATAVASNPEKVLRKGSRGEAVKDLQEKLIAKGFSLPKYGTDGHYGDETVAAVKSLQKAAGITVDGIYGPASAKALNSYKKPAAKKTTSKASGSAIVPYPGKLIRKGSRGKDVERIQRAVKVKADGIFGSGTEAAVKAYQKRKGLSADGIVGPDTWNMMF